MALKEVEPLPTKETFPGLVNYETIYRAGFNYWEPSFGRTFNGQDFKVYICGQGMNQGQPNIIVGSRKLKDNTYEWHFGSFVGTPIGESNREEAEFFLKKVDEILGPENIVSGHSLQDRILEIVEKK